MNEFAFYGFGVVSVVWTVGTGIFWIVIGVRFLRTHERLAAAVDQIARVQNAPPRRAE